MCTTYAPTRAANLGAPLAYTPTRYRGAAALCEAIRAAAALAPELAPTVEFGERYFAGHYRHYVPGEHEPGTVLRMRGRDLQTRELFALEITTEGAACVWPRIDVQPEKPGPFLPVPDDARVTFSYSTPDGARGSLTVSNLSGALLALADKVHATRAAFDGKTRRAPRPSKPAGSAPHVTARAMWKAADYAGALNLARNVGPVFFGRGPDGKPPIAYMGAEHVRAAGDDWVIARRIDTGAFYALHVDCALSLGDAFKSHSAALDSLESKAAEEGFRAKLDGARAKHGPFSQTAALAHYMGADATETDDTAAPVHANAPADAVAPVTTENAPTGPDSSVYESMQAPDSATAEARAMVARFYDDNLTGAPGCTVPNEAKRARAAHWLGSASGFADHAPGRGLPYWLAARLLGADADAKADTGPTAPRYRFACHLIGTDSQRIESRDHECTGPGLTSADIESAHAELRDMAAARGMRIVSENFGDYAARAWCEPVPPAYAIPGPLPTHSHAPAPVFRYALVNRPAHIGAIPRGLEFTIDARPDRGAPHHETARHGILNAARELTPDECRSFELLPLIDGPAVDEIARSIAAALSDYAAEYLAQAADEPDEFRAAVMQRTETRRASIGDPAALVSAVLAALGAMVSEQAKPAAPATHSEVKPPATHTDADAADEWAKLMAEVEARRVQAAAIAAAAEFPECGGSVRFTHSDGERYGIAGPDMSAPGRFRFSHFDARGPVGHLSYASLADAVREVMYMGYAAVAPGAPDAVGAIEPPATQFEPEEVARLVGILQARAETATAAGAERSDSFRVQAAAMRERAANLRRPLHPENAAYLAKHGGENPTQRAGLEMAAANAIGAAIELETMADAEPKQSPPATQSSAPTYGIAAGIEAWQIAAAQPCAVYSTPVYRIGKHEWATIVYAHPQFGACTDHVWRRVDQNRGIFRRANEWPAYNSDDTFSGLPRSLGDKVFNPHRAEIETALADAKALRFTDGVPESTRDTARRGMAARAEWAAHIERTRLASAPPATQSEAAPAVETLAAPPAEIIVDMASLPPATQSGPWRFSACDRPEYAPTNRTVHVLFTPNRERAAGKGGESAGACVGFYMARQTYGAIPLSELATPEDFERFGPVQMAPAGYLWSDAERSAEAQRNGVTPATQPAPAVSGPLAMLRHHVSGAIERGEAVAIVEERAAPADALRQHIDGMHPHDVYDVLADNGYETEETRFLSAEGMRDALETMAREVGAGAFSWMLAKLTADDEEPTDERADLSERARASVAQRTPSLRIPAGDPRTRIPARFAPVYLLRG